MKYNSCATITPFKYNSSVLSTFRILHAYCYYLAQGLVLSSQKEALLPTPSSNFSLHSGNCESAFCLSNFVCSGISSILSQDFWSLETVRTQRKDGLKYQNSAGNSDGHSIRSHTDTVIIYNYLKYLF